MICPAAIVIYLIPIHIMPESDDADPNPDSAVPVASRLRFWP